jgi:hypothetical protein
MVNMYQHRGGTPDEFVQALYAVNRELKINGGVSPTSSRKSRSSNCSSGRGSMTNNKYQHLSDSDTSGNSSATIYIHSNHFFVFLTEFYEFLFEFIPTGTQISQDSLLSGTRKRSNPSVNRSSGNGSSGKRKAKRRKVIQLPGSSGDDEGEVSSGNSSDSDSEPERNSGLGKTNSKANSSCHASSIDQR